MEFKDLTDDARRAINFLIEKYTDNVAYIDIINNIPQCLYRKGESPHRYATKSSELIKQVRAFLLENDFVEDKGNQFDILPKWTALRRAGTIEMYYEKAKNTERALKSKIEKRIDILCALYDKTAGTKITCDLLELAEEYGLYDSQFEASYHWLKDQRLIELNGAGYRAHLSNYGINEVERKRIESNKIISTPEPSRIHIGDVHNNITVGGDMIGSGNAQTSQDGDVLIKLNNIKSTSADFQNKKSNEGLKWFLGILIALASLAWAIYDHFHKAA